ncbi:MARVEL domain-containing protein [Fusarium sp. LHS14.1]|nr:MARVEL domain-containing protein [Fusarium sp. LHS14.1]
MSYEKSGSAHKVCSIILRLGQISCAAIVIGILARFSYLLTIEQVHEDGRLVYAMVVAGMSIIYSFLLCPPFRNLFMSFPCDFVLFVMWLVAYCLLQTKSTTHTCSSRWYRTYWGYYWGSYWRVGRPGVVNVGRAGCSHWRTVLAFSFIAWLAYLLSGILGIIVFHKYIKVKETTAEFKHQAKKHLGRDSQENDYGRPVNEPRGAGVEQPVTQVSQV